MFLIKKRWGGGGVEGLIIEECNPLLLCKNKIHVKYLLFKIIFFLTWKNNVIKKVNK